MKAFLKILLGIFSAVLVNMGTTYTTDLIKNPYHQVQHGWQRTAKIFIWDFKDDDCHELHDSIKAKVTKSIHKKHKPYHVKQRHIDTTITHVH